MCSENVGFYFKADDQSFYTSTEFQKSQVSSNQKKETLAADIRKTYYKWSHWEKF